MRDVVEQEPSTQYDHVAALARQLARLSPPDNARLSQYYSEETRKRDAEMSAKVGSGTYAALGNESPSSMPSYEELSLANIDEVMRYQPWDREQTDHGEVIRDALAAAAKAILRHAPRSPRRTLALQHVVTARMDANAAISFRGRF